MPLYPLSKQVLLGLTLSFPLVSCGDGGTDPADLIDVAIVSGDGQSAGLGETLSQDLVVRTSDALGNTVANVDLLFSVVQGSARPYRRTSWCGRPTPLEIRWRM